MNRVSVAGRSGGHAPITAPRYLVRPATEDLSEKEPLATAKAQTPDPATLPEPPDPQTWQLAIAVRREALNECGLSSDEFQNIRHSLFPGLPTGTLSRLQLYQLLRACVLEQLKKEMEGEG